MILDTCRRQARPSGRWLLAGLLSLALAPVFAAAPAEIDIVGAYIRETPPGVTVAGGYLVLVNRGGKARRFIGGEADFAGAVELHEMRMEDDMMRMRRIEDGLSIPPGGRVELKPGGYHLMLVQLRQPLLAGERVDVRLEFDQGATVSATFTVVGLGQIPPGQ